MLTKQQTILRDLGDGLILRRSTSDDADAISKFNADVHGEDENDQGCLGTAMHAVHAIAPVCAAPPGIATFLDLPTIVGRHVLRQVATR